MIIISLSPAPRGATISYGPGRAPDCIGQGKREEYIRPTAAPGRNQFATRRDPANRARLIRWLADDDDAGPIQSNAMTAATVHATR